MARIRGHRPLDFGQPIYVRAGALKGWDRTFKRGDLFPWREMKVLPRKVHQLWMQRKLGHEQIGDLPNGAEGPYPIIPMPLVTTSLSVLTDSELDKLMAPTSAQDDAGPRWIHQGVNDEGRHVYEPEATLPTVDGAAPTSAPVTIETTTATAAKRSPQRKR